MYQDSEDFAFNLGVIVGGSVSGIICLGVTGDPIVALLSVAVVILAGVAVLYTEIGQRITVKAAQALEEKSQAAGKKGQE